MRTFRALTRGGGALAHLMQPRPLPPVSKRGQCDQRGIELPEIAPQFAEYQDILRRLLAKSPADRYQSAGALLEAISALKIPA